MRTIPVFRVKMKALEAYITTIYRFEFDFLIAVGQIAGQVVEYKVTGEEIGSNTWRVRAHELRCGQRTRNVGLILNVLAHDGFIPKGHYTIDTHAAPVVKTSAPGDGPAEEKP